MKYVWNDKKREFPLSKVCAILDISVSGFRPWQRDGKPNSKRLTDIQMLELIQSIHAAELKWIYSSPRIFESCVIVGFRHLRNGLNA